MQSSFSNLSARSSTGSINSRWVAKNFYVRAAVRVRSHTAPALLARHTIFRTGMRARGKSASCARDDFGNVALANTKCGEGIAIFGSVHGSGLRVSRKCKKIKRGRRNHHEPARRFASNRMGSLPDEAHTHAAKPSDTRCGSAGVYHYRSGDGQFQRRLLDWYVGRRRIRPRLRLQLRRALAGEL